MRNVFEPNALELADLGGDTHFITDIQRQVEQLLKPSNTDRQKLRAELASRGARAVPGILNAAYVFNHRLEAKREREFLADLLASLIDTNEAARALLLKSGILEAPFAATCDTALLALQRLGDIHPEEVNAIRKRAWESAYHDEDYQGALRLYRFLITQRDSQSYSEIRYLAQETFSEYLDIAPLFLDLALCCASENTYEILVKTIGEMEREEKEFGKEIRRMSADSVFNLTEVLRAAYVIKENSVGYGHKGLQYLFTGPIRELFNKAPEKIAEVGTEIQQRYSSLARFFWQSLGGLLRSEEARQYFNAQIFDRPSDFSCEAIVQLFFTQENDGEFKIWAKELLEELEGSTIYSDATYEFEKRQGRPPLMGERKRRSGSTRLNK